MIHSSVAKAGLAVLCLSAIFACSNIQTAENSGQAKFASQESIEFPKLLDRAEKLRNGIEWDNVQNFYAAQCSKLRQDASDVEAKIKLAECFIQEARVTGEHPHYYPAAMKMLDLAIAQLGDPAKLNAKQIDPYFRALSHKASVQLSLHDFAAAKKTTEAAIAINPHNAYIYGCLVDANVELGNYKSAVEACDKMVSIRPDLRSYSRVSYLREIYGDLPGAIEAMEMAVKAGLPGQEQTEWARLQLGNLYLEKGDLQSAENQYNMSLAVRENYPFALAALAELEVRRGNFEKAETLFKQAIEIVPEIGFNIDLAKLYLNSGRKAETEKMLPEIQTMFSEDIAAGHNMSLEAGHFYLELMNDTEKALEFANEELARRPENIAVNDLLADIYMKKGDKAKANFHAQKAKI